MENNIFFQRWIQGIPYEIAFWNSYYWSKKRREDLYRWSAYGKECVLDSFDVQQYIGTLPTADPLIVDVGCALSYAMGNLFRGKPDARVQYMDPLASFYNEILDRYNIERPRIKFGMIECISGFYPANSVDMIHVRNALDHCANPMSGIMQALICLRKGGVLYLNHFKNEALNEGYRGFHQWNITIEDGKLIVWNQEIRIDVAEAIDTLATVETSITPQGRMVAVIRKLKDGDIVKYTSDATAYTVESMMEVVRYFHRPYNSVKYQISILWSTIGHRIMRIIPYSVLNWFKRLMSKK